MSTNSGDNIDLIGEAPGGEHAHPPSGFGHAYDSLGTDEGIMDRARTFYDRGVGAWEENRRMHSEDLHFIYNAEQQGQWDPVVLQNRRGKPCYTFNRCIGPVNIVVADMRQTRPDGKVRPASDGATEPVAEIFGGLCRSIEQASRADQIYKEQYKYAVAGGFGAWRVMPMYMTEGAKSSAFDQVLRVINISNPQTVIWDPQCSDPCAGDANQCIVAERISEDIYHATYKDGEGQSFNLSRDSYGWFTDKEVRIAEYFERVPTSVQIAKMKSGKVIEYNAAARAAEETFEKEGLTYEEHGVDRVARYKTGKLMVRHSVDWKVMWVKIDGTNVLEGPILYDWKRIPVIRCPGRYINIEGRKKFQSLIRHAKDAQRSYNSRASDMIERSILVPKAPYLVTETMIKGYEGVWAEANVSPRPYLPYNVDPKAAGSNGMPHREAPIDMPEGAIALAQQAISDIQATIGYYDASLGNAEEANRVSGKALVQHNKRSDLGSYEFIDGYGAALQLTWEIFIDMIPSVYDAQRIERIIGADGIEREVTINHLQSSGDIVNDLKEGVYQVTVTIGPNYQTARQEALDTLLGIAENLPNAGGVIADLIAKNVDTPDAAEMARRLRIPLIQQGIVTPTPEEAEQVKKVQPNPQQQRVQAEQQLLQEKIKKMAADATIAGGRASAAPILHQKEVMEVANKHMANLKIAHDIGNDRAAAQAEAAAAGQQMQQDQQAHQQGMQQDDQQHQQQLQQDQQQQQQDQQQQMQEHQAGLLRTHQEHVANLLKERATHEHKLRIDHESHEQELRHAREKHAAELEHASKLAEIQARNAAKPKPKKAA